MMYLYQLCLFQGQNDYNVPRQVTVPACRNKTLRVEILNDEVVERNETVIIRGLTSHSSIRTTGGSMTITITDNDSKIISLN